ncbi:MAG TPA: hypothetical protein VE032_08410 [Actinomycetota bacterium]|nr:hypothetical protein [Actinomycetota bacterium]
MTTVMAGAHRSPTARSTTLPLWPGAVVALGLFLYLIAPGTATLFPANVAALIAFGAMLSLLPAVRPRSISPLGWALLLFGLTMVVCPILIAFFGPALSVLPRLPDAGSMRAALAVTTLAFLCFCVAANWGLHRFRITAQPTRSAWFRTNLPRWVTTTFFVLGALGLVASFGGPGGILASLTPASAREARLEEATIVTAAGLLLRPFLAFGIVMTWCRWSDRVEGTRRHVRSTLALTMLGTLAASLTFGFNRASVVYPLVALLATYARRVRPIKAAGALGIAATIVLLVLAIGSYRASDATLGELTGTSDPTPVPYEFDLNEQVQIYGAAPQFLGFVMTEADRVPTGLGRTLVSGLVAPLPILGEPFRSSAGTGLYNRWIYGPGEVRDQVIPFAGEMFLDLRLLGVVLGSIVIGVLVARLQAAFERARSSTGVFIAMYVGMWLAFPIIGSAEVVSQTFIYGMWPVYAAIGYAIVRDRGRRTWDPSRSAGFPTGGSG